MKRFFFTTVSTVILLSACGGGSSSAVSPVPTLDITSNNAMQVSKTAYEASQESQSLGNASGGFIVPVASGFGESIDGAFTKTANSSSSSQIPIPPETIVCAAGGTQTISGDIADPLTPTLTPGDWFQVAYSACNDGLGTMMDGTVRMVIDAFSGDFLSQNTSMTITLTLTNFQVSVFENQSPTPTEVVTSNGGATLTLNALNFPVVSTSISGNSLVVDTNASSQSLTNFLSEFAVDGNLVPSPYSTSASGTLDSTELGGVVRYSNPVEFTGLGGGYPDSGEFLVEGLGSSLLLVAENNVDVRIEIDLGDDGTIDETINTTWAELTADSLPGT